jgi:hypothetical protein
MRAVIFAFLRHRSRSIATSIMKNRWMVWYSQRYSITHCSLRKFIISNIYPKRNEGMRESMKNQPYETPVMRRLGSVRDLTKGGSGTEQDPGGAGSFTPLPPLPPPV